MLSKERRLPRSFFPYVLNAGVKRNSPHLVLFVSKNGQLEPKSRFCFSVSKKNVKSAVSRNKLRRQGYSVIEKNPSLMGSNLLCFFSFKKGADKVDYKTIEREVSSLISDLKT